MLGHPACGPAQRTRGRPSIDVSGRPERRCRIPSRRRAPWTIGGTLMDLRVAGPGAPLDDTGRRDTSSRRGLRTRVEHGTEGPASRRGELRPVSAQQRSRGAPPRGRDSFPDSGGEGRRRRVFGGDGDMSVRQIRCGGASGTGSALGRSTGHVHPVNAYNVHLETDRRIANGEMEGVEPGAIGRGPSGIPSRSARTGPPRGRLWTVRISAGLGQAGTE
jgi:hypothetical protein